MGLKKAVDLLVVLLDSFQKGFELIDKHQDEPALDPDYGGAGLELQSVQLGINALRGEIGPGCRWVFKNPTSSGSKALRVASRVG
ncbi:MAG: hypothetical protein H5U03_02425 [Clostridia bacterium]|nr:hypothetical protein [Clostridia bacterium]